MFGYVRTCTPELRVKENEFYKALYCGLCRAMGKRSPFLSLSLSYDFVFLALVRMALSGEKVEFGKKRCVSHPFRKRLYVKSSLSLEYCASASALLLYYNLKDDLSDKKGIRRMASALCLPKAKSMRKSALGDGKLDGLIAGYLDEISSYEREGRTGIYTCAEPFGKLLGEVFSHEIEDEARRRCLFELGRRIGRWIYLVDALDDLEEDRKTGSYNPFLISGEDKTEHFRENMKDALTFELIEAEKAVSLLDFSDEGMFSIIQNILYLGLPKVAEDILNPKEKDQAAKKKGKKHRRNESESVPTVNDEQGLNT
ncbi:MAG: DUF5685 family protein [Eubacteriales bacterium]